MMSEAFRSIGRRRFVQSVRIVSPELVLAGASLLFAALICLLTMRVDLRLVLAALALLTLITIMFVHHGIAIPVILFVMYANLSVVAIRFHGVPPVVAGAFFLLLGIPLLNYIILRRQRLLINRTLFLMMIYFFVAIASVFFSRDPGRSFERLATFLLEGVILYFLLLNTIRTSKILRHAMWALILAGCFMGGFSLYQEVTKKYDDPLWGIAQAKESVISVGEEETGEKIVRRRLAGPVGSKNRYAQIMVVLLPLALFRLWGERSRMLRLLAAAACVPIVAAVLLTFSRAAGITIAVLLFSLLLLGYIKLRHFVLLAAGTVLLVVLIVPGYVYRFSTVEGVFDLFSGRAIRADASIRGRATENLAMLHIFFDHPILGVGTGQAPLYSEEYGETVGYRKLEGTRRGHNMYLEEIAETGIFGFAVFMSIVLLTLRELAWARARWAFVRPEFSNLAATFFFSILTYLATALFLHLSYQRYYWVWLGLAGAALEIFRTEGNAELTEAIASGDRNQGAVDP